MPDGTTLRYSMFLGTVRRAYRLAWPFLMSHAVRSIPSDASNPCWAGGSLRLDLIVGGIVLACDLVRPERPFVSSLPPRIRSFPKGERNGRGGPYNIGRHFDGLRLMERSFLAT